MKIINKPYGYVYVTIDQKENKVYVGQTTKEIEEEYYGSGTIIRRIIQKRGTFFLKRLVLGFCYSREELLECELECKHFFNSLNPLYGYNIALKDFGGDVLSNHPDRDRIIQTNYGKWKGRHHSEESRQKISKTRKIILSDPAIRANMNQDKKGKPRSEEERMNISNGLKGHIPWNKGLKHNKFEEVRQAS